jgi:hypothetical protein
MSGLCCLHHPGKGGDVKSVIVRLDDGLDVNDGSAIDGFNGTD